VPAAAGIGLRFQHHAEVLATRPAVAWLEVHTENYMGGGPAISPLEAIRRDYPVSLHGVGLSLGNPDGLDGAHLERIRDVVRRIESGLVSENLSWSAIGGNTLVDLLPLPMTDEALDLVCRHCRCSSVAAPESARSTISCGGAGGNDPALILSTCQVETP
jgi:uncharacterized protein (UPF0276 family)